MRFVFAVFALIAAACAPQTTTAPAAPSANTAALPAPSPGDIAIHITDAQNGQTVEVPLNQRFAVELVGVPTAGYQWAPAQLPQFLSRAGEASGPTIAAQNQPGYAGGNHWEVTMFVATAAGSGELVMEQRRPWEANEPPARTFRVTIVAR